MEFWSTINKIKLPTSTCWYNFLWTSLDALHYTYIIETWCIVWGTSFFGRSDFNKSLQFLSTNERIAQSLVSTRQYRLELTINWTVPFSVHTYLNVPDVCLNEMYSQEVKGAGMLLISFRDLNLKLFVSFRGFRVECKCFYPARYLFELHLHTVLMV